MSTEPDATANPESAAEHTPPAEPAGEQKPAPSPEPATNRRKDADGTTRSARYALVTAVVAAVISSFVSAGAAIYVSINQSNRNDRQAQAQTLHADRQKIYGDFSLALFNYNAELGTIRGKLMAHNTIESVRPDIGEFAGRTNELMARLNLVLMAGSSGMQDVAGRFADTQLAFARDHFLPFSMRYFEPNAAGAADGQGWERDSAAMVTAIDGVTDKIGTFNGAFVQQGSKDLR